MISTQVETDTTGRPSWRPLLLPSVSAVAVAAVAGLLLLDGGDRVLAAFLVVISLAIALHTFGVSARVRELQARVAELDATRGELELANLELGQLNRSLQRFAGVVAHDIKAPMALVVSTLEFLSLDPPAEREGRLLATAHRRAQRCVDLTSVLLAHTRLLTEHEERGPVALGEVMDDALDQLSAQVEEVRPTLRIEPLPDVIGNPTLLLQVFQNVLSNAIRYRRPDEPCRIDVSCTVEGDTAVVRVADNGRGIPARERGAVFRFGVSEGGESTGIGLATAAMVVAAHAGSIEAEDSELGGATIVIRLPLAPHEERVIDLDASALSGADQ